MLFATTLARVGDSATANAPGDFGRRKLLNVRMAAVPNDSGCVSSSFGSIPSFASSLCSRERLRSLPNANALPLHPPSYSGSDVDRVPRDGNEF